MVQFYTHPVIHFVIIFRCIKHNLAHIPIFIGKSYVLLFIYNEDIAWHRLPII